MAQYKFLDSEHIGLVLAGRLRFRSLTYYRLLEVVYKNNKWIGDLSEGVATTWVRDVSFGPTMTDAPARKSLEDAGVIKADDHSSVRIENMKIVQEVGDCLVFSFSVGDLPQLSAAMCDPNRPEVAYDACVSIASPELLVDAIARTGILMNGVAVNETFDVAFGPVDYGLTEYEVVRDGVGKPDPFRKHPRYSAQQEWRVILFPIRPYGPADYLDVTVGDPSALFREAFRNLPVRQSPWRTPVDRSHADLLEELLDALDASQLEESAPPQLMSYVSAEQHFAVMMKRNEERERIFREHRDRIVQAYWALRPSHPDVQIDSCVVNCAPSFRFLSLLRRYVTRISHSEV